MFRYSKVYIHKAEKETIGVELAIKSKAQEILDSLKVEKEQIIVERKGAANSDGISMG
jgi:hypothetical protein